MKQNASPNNFYSPSSAVVEFVDGLLFEVVNPFVEDIDDLVVFVRVKVVVGLVGIEGLGMTSSTSGFPPLPFSKTRDE